MKTWITKSVRISIQESAILKKMSKVEGVSEAALLRRFVREGLAAHILEQAIIAYTRGEADLSAAAKYANVSVYHFMNEIKQRDIAPPAEAEKFVDGLKTLVEIFGGSEALQQTIDTLSK